MLTLGASAYILHSISTTMAFTPKDWSRRSNSFSQLSSHFSLRPDPSSSASSINTPSRPLRNPIIPTDSPLTHAFYLNKQFSNVSMPSPHSSLSMPSLNWGSNEDDSPFSVSKPSFDEDFNLSCDVSLSNLQSDPTNKNDTFSSSSNSLLTSRQNYSEEKGSMSKNKDKQKHDSKLDLTLNNLELNYSFDLNVNFSSNINESEEFGVQNPALNQETQHDVFGLGSFRDVFITECDLEQAQDKLPEDEIKTKEETLTDMITKLLSYSCEPVSDDHSTAESLTSQSKNEFPNVSVCFNFVTLGIGSLTISETGILWDGSLLYPESDATTLSDNHNEISNTTLTFSPQHCTLLFKLFTVTDARMKSIGNEKPMVMITVNETLFIQFPFCDEQNAALCVEKIRSLQRGHIPNEENDSATNIPSFITNNHPESFEGNASTDYTKTFSEIEETYRSDLALIQRERDSKMQAIEDEYRVKLRELQQAKDRKIQELRSRENSQVISKLQSDDLLDIVKANLSSEVGDCQLCYDSTESKVILPCHHRLCSSCAEKLIETSSKCPWDRNEFEKIVELGKPCGPQPH